MIRTRLRGGAALGRALRDSMMRESDTRAELERSQDSTAPRSPEMGIFYNQLGGLVLPVDAPVSAKDDTLAPCPVCKEPGCGRCDPPEEENTCTGLENHESRIAPRFAGATGHVEETATAPVSSPMLENRAAFESEVERFERLGKIDGETHGAHAFFRSRSKASLALAKDLLVSRNLDLLKDANCGASVAADAIMRGFCVEWDKWLERDEAT